MQPTDPQGQDRELLDAALGPDPTHGRLPIEALLACVGPAIIEARDAGDHLAPLPAIGTPEWHRASDQIKWAVIALAALQGMWAAERGPTERIAYAESLCRIEVNLDWAAEAYKAGYAAGRREQKATERRIRAGRNRRGVA